MSTEHYLTLYKSESSIEEVVYKIPKADAEKVLLELQHDGVKYVSISVDEPIKSNKQVLKRTVNLNLFKSLNEVEVFDKTLKLTGVILKNHKLTAKLEEMRIINKGDSFKNARLFDLSFHDAIDSKLIYGILITKFKNCKIISCTENEFTYEIFMTYEEYEHNIVLPTNKKIKTNLLDKKENIVESTNIQPRGKKIIPADLICVYIDNFAWGMVVKLEIDGNHVIDSGCEITKQGLRIHGFPVKLES